MTTTPRRDLLAGLALIAASATAILVVIPAQTRSGGGAAQGLESALMPTIAASAVLVLSVVLAMQSLLHILRTKHASSGAPPLDGEAVALQRWRGPAAVLVAVAGAVGMHFIGAWAGLAFVIASGMLLLGESRATRIVPTVVLSVGAIYLFAERAIGTALP